MGATQDILGNLNIEQLAGMLGVDAGTAESAAAAAIPTLLGAFQANSADPAGAEALAGALSQHADSGIDGSDLSAVDTADGLKIVQHALADDPQRLSAVQGVGGDLLAKLLPILAPIVLNYLAKKFLGGGAPAAATDSSSMIGDLIGGLLGGSSGGSSAGSDALGDLIGGLLGGGAAPAQTKQASSTDALGDLLGQILGR